MLNYNIMFNILYISQDFYGKNLFVFASLYFNSDISMGYRTTVFSFANVFEKYKSTYKKFT